jgi:tetratricopeptide (TPR) repeat protein
MELLRVLVLPMTLMLFCNTNPVKTERAIFISLMSIAILGLLAFFRVIYIPGAVIETTNRLQSVIQYANTTALLMLIGILYSIHSYISNRKIGKLICCLIFAVTLLLTGSRTSLMVALAVCTLYALIMSQRRGKLIVSGSVVLAVLAVVGFNLFTDIRIFRISIFEATLVERYITYQDAISMMRGNWLLGIGTGNWQEWQFIYQSAPYNVKFIHNYYLQLLLDGGILAPLLFLAATLPSVIKGLSKKNIHAFILIAVMSQALLDFDLIFSAVAMIAMFSLSQLIAGRCESHSRVGSDKTGGSRILRGIMSDKTVSIEKLRFIALAPMLVILVLWCSEIYSSNADINLLQGNKDVAMSRYRTALALNPLKTELYYQMAQSADDIETAQELLETAIEKNPRDLQSISALVMIESQRGNFAVALDLCEILIENRRHFEEYRSLFLQTAESALISGVINQSQYEEIQTRLRLIPLQTNPLYRRYILSTQVITDSLLKSQIISETAVLIDADTGEVLFDKDMHKLMHPASITKIMTALLALEHCDVSETITMSYEAVHSLGNNAANIMLVPGEELTLEQAVYAMGIVSANDASNGVAEHVGATIDKFVEMMNRRAFKEGALNTTFVNTHGMPDDSHFSTAYDMAYIAMAAINTPGFNKMFSANIFVIPTTNRWHENRVLRNRNSMITGEFVYDGLIAGKTGWTQSSGYTLFTAATRDNRTLIGILLNSPDIDDRYKDMTLLLDYGFNKL